MTTAQFRARAVVAALLLTVALGACGKKGGLQPPEGEAANYTYPRAYPPTKLPQKAPEEPEPLPPGASAPEKLSPFPLPFERTTPTRTYGTQ